MYFVDSSEFKFIQPWPKDDIDATCKFLEQSVVNNEKYDREE